MWEAILRLIFHGRVDVQAEAGKLKEAVIKADADLTREQAPLYGFRSERSDMQAEQRKRIGTCVPWKFHQSKQGDAIETCNSYSGII